jgi:ketosteroid isomerase-like protein
MKSSHREILPVMGEENVETVRRAWETVASRGVPAALEFFAEDCVMEDFPELPDASTYLGKDGVIEIERHFRETWGDFEQEPVEFIDAGNDLVVAAVAMRGRGKGSGAPLDAQAFWVHEVRDGLIARMRAFTTRQQAFEATGFQG